MNTHNQHAKDLQTAYEYGRDGYPMRLIPCCCHKCERKWHEGRQDAAVLYHPHRDEPDGTRPWGRQ